MLICSIIIAKKRLTFCNLQLILIIESNPGLTFLSKSRKIIFYKFILSIYPGKKEREINLSTSLICHNSVCSSRTVFSSRKSLCASTKLVLVFSQELFHHKKNLHHPISCFCLLVCFKMAHGDTAATTHEA